MLGLGLGLGLELDDAKVEMPMLLGEYRIR